jgi:hypothetical protein
VNGLEDGGVAADLLFLSFEARVSGMQEWGAEGERTFPEGVSPSPPMRPALWRYQRVSERFERGQEKKR